MRSAVRFFWSLNGDFQEIVRYKCFILKKTLSYYSCYFIIVIYRGSNLSFKGHQNNGRTRRKRNAFRKHIYKLAKVCGWVLIVCFIVEFIQIARAEVLNHRRLNESSIRGFQNFCTSWAVVVFNTAWTSIAQCYDNSTSRTVNPLCWPILSGRYIFIHTSSKIFL